MQLGERCVKTLVKNLHFTNLDVVQDVNNRYCPSHTAKPEVAILKLRHFQKAINDFCRMREKHWTI